MELSIQISIMGEDELPIICGGTHYFIQHFLFPPPEMSFDRRPSSEGISSESVPDLEELESRHDEPAARHQRWSPPFPRPKVPNDMDPALLRLLDTFYTSYPVYPNSGEKDENEAGPSNHNTTRLVPTDPDQLLSLHKLLATIDPREAGRWDWRDGRKVRRGIERWWERGGATDDYVNPSAAPSSGRKAR